MRADLCLREDRMSSLHAWYVHWGAPWWFSFTSRMQEFCTILEHWRVFQRFHSRVLKYLLLPNLPVVYSQSSSRHSRYSDMTEPSPIIFSVLLFISSLVLVKTLASTSKWVWFSLLPDDTFLHLFIMILSDNRQGDALGNYKCWASALLWYCRMYAPTRDL